MIHVILYEPEIPSNTGNIIRLCANTGAQLHLIKPLGFELDDKKLRRAGLDYHEWATLKVWNNFSQAFNELDAQLDAIFPMTTKAEKTPYNVNLNQNIGVLLGPETRGLPAEILDQFPNQQWLRLPMQPNSRSLNLSNATAVIIYEALRQQQFAQLLNH